MVLAVCFELEVGYEAEAGAAISECGPEVTLDVFASDCYRRNRQHDFEVEHVVRSLSVLSQHTHHRSTR